MRRATLTTAAAATAALALLLRPADALRVFSHTQRNRQAKEVVATADAVEGGPFSDATDHNRTLAIHGAGNGSAGVAAFDIGYVHYVYFGPLGGPIR